MTTEPFTLRESDTIGHAGNIMAERHIRHIPVVDGDSHVVGLVTQRDVLGAKGADAETPLSEIMIRNVSAIDKDDSLRKAALYMQSHKYGCLPVLSDGRLIGIITDSDFVAIAINLIEQAELYEQEIGSDDLM